MKRREPKQEQTVKIRRLITAATLALAAVAFVAPDVGEARMKIIFKMPTMLDRGVVSVRVNPSTEIDVVREGLSFIIRNDSDIIYADFIGPNQFVPNAKGNKWKFKQDVYGVEQIYSATVTKKVNKITLQNEYVIRFKFLANLFIADPSRNPGWTEAQLSHIYAAVVIGDDAFSDSATWQRIPRNTTTPVRGWKNSVKYLD